MSFRLLGWIRAACVAAAGVLGGSCGGAQVSDSCTSNDDCSAGYVCTDSACLPDANLGAGSGNNNNNNNNTNGNSNTNSNNNTNGNNNNNTPTSVDEIPDTTGPFIEITNPLAYDIVGFHLVITATITDPSGVDPSSVRATIGYVATSDDLYEVPLVAAGEEYSAYFNTTPFLGRRYPSVFVTAKDGAGNEATSGWEVALDHTPPVVSLESAPVQMRKEKDDAFVCSHAFPPLGSDNVQHGGVYPDVPDRFDVFPVRARIQDYGNGVPFSGVDDTTVRVYFLDSVGISAGNELVVDSSGDGRCDSIGPDALPSPAGPEPDQALPQNLVPVPFGGDPRYMPFGAADTSSWTCLDESDEEPPDPICEYSDIDYWLGWGFENVPAVYVLNAYVDDPEYWLCSGGPFDIYNLAADGPACLAVVARDNVENAATSTPIAICIDRDGVGGECAGFDADATRLACTDGCTAPGFGSSTSFTEVHDED